MQQLINLNEPFFLNNKFLADKTEPFDSSNIGYVIINKKMSLTQFDDHQDLMVQGAMLMVQTHMMVQGFVEDYLWIQ